MNNSESIARETGLDWLYDAISPTEHKKESFSTHAQLTSSQTEDISEVGFTMDRLSLGNNITMKPKHYSSNILQPFPNMGDHNFQVPRFQHFSSQSVNISPNVESSQQWMGSPIEPFHHITSVTNLPVTLLFDFEINEDFKLSQVKCNYFYDSDSHEVVYFCPLAEQIVLYNFNCYIKCTVFLPPTQPGIMRMQEKVY